MKFAIFPLTLLALALAFLPVSSRASDTIPLRFLSPAITVTEADSVAQLQVLRAEDADHPIEIDFITQPGNATPGADYTAMAGTVIFAPGEHFKLIEIPVLNDGLPESGETFRVVLTNATGGEISETFGSSTITIRDNDPGLSFEISTYNFAETQSEVVLNVRRGSDGIGKITVDYAIVADTATSGIDYLPVNGTLSFEPNDLIQTIRVPILQDFLHETAETFRVVLSNPSSGASLGIPNIATVRLLDNDQGFRFSPSSYDVSESEGEAVLYVSRATDLPGELSVEYSIEPVLAVPNLDYTPVRGTLVFAAEQFSGIIRVPILNDGLKETVKTFRVVLSNPSAGTLLGTPSVATVRIANNDTGFSFSGGSNYSFSEDGKVVLSVDRGSDLSVETSVEYAIEPVSATPDLDYTPVSGRLVFAAENYSATIEIPILNDHLKEGTETFRVRLGNPSLGTSLGTSSVATVRILDNDPGFNLGSSSYSIAEDHEVSISVQRGTDPVGEASVDYSVEADSATVGLDFAPVSGRLTFLDEQIYKVIQIPIFSDTLQETAEMFRVTLSNPSPGSFLGSPATATVRISDNDPGFYFDWPTHSVIETNREVGLLVWRGSDPTSAVSVDYIIEPNTASPELDYMPIQGTLLFAAQEISKTIFLPILNDMISEGRESFSVVLSNPSAGAHLGTPNRATVMIQDDDIGFVFECTAGDLYCGNPPENMGAAKMDVVIRGDFKFTNSVSVDFVTEAATAAANLDFLATSGTLTFAPAETRKTVTIPLINDGLFEANETFRVTLRNPVGLAQVGALPRFTFTIQENERGYSIESNTDDGRLILPQTPGDVLINVHRGGDFNYSSSVDFRTSEPGEWVSTSQIYEQVTALPGHNFVAAAGTLTFAAGETNRTITLRLIDARRARLAERFFIELSNPTGGSKIWEAQRLLEIQPNERNPLRVDPGFSAEVSYSSSGGGDLQLLPDGRIVMASSLLFETGEDGLGIVRLLRDGTRDPSFTVARTSGFNLLALQPNGQVLVGGPPEFTINGATVRQLARLNTDGSLDSSFLAQLPKPTNASVTAVAAQSDGKILVAADSGLLVRLNPDGSLDISSQAIADGPISRIVLDKEGRALISGGFGLVQNEARPGLARLLSDGSLDRSFLTDWQLGAIYRFDLETEGTVLVTYYDNNGASTFARLTQDGRVDPTFQADARLASFAYPYSVFVFPAPDRKVFVSEQQGGGSGMLSRLNSDGSLDDSFLTGTLTVTFQSSGGWGPQNYSVTAEYGGDLLIDGGINDELATVNGTPTAALGRLLLNGGSPPVTVDPGSAQILETNGFVNVTLVRTGNTAGAYTVNWATESGTALPGVDFLAASGTATFAPGESDHAISIQLLDNQELDGNRTVRLRLTTPDGIPLPSVELTIANDDLGFVPGGSYAFPNGRFLINLTGRRTGTNFRIQRSTDLLYWEDWTYSSAAQFIDYEASPPNGTRKFYRLIGD